jgi:hypothetical protein
LPQVQKLIVWARFGKDAEGDRCIPEGRQCGPCKQTVHGPFSACPHETLTSTRASTPELDACFHKERHGIVNHGHYGTARTRKGKVDVAHYVKKRAEKFTEKVGEAEFWTLQKICDARAPDKDFDGEKVMRQYVEDKLGYEVIDCGDGIPGVAVMNEQVKPKIRMGLRESAIQDKVQQQQSSAEGTVGSINI